MMSSVDAFMATMVAQSRPVPIERAVALAWEHYGLDTRATRLTGERDENFKLTAADGAEYVFKIANGAEDPAVTELPTAALLHVAAADPAFPCPRVLRALDGGTQIRFADTTGIERTARMLTYLPGRLLNTAARSRRQRAACGRIGARLTRALRAFEHAAAHRAIIWDVRHAGHMRRLLTELPHFAYRTAVLELLSHMLPIIELQFPQLRHQIVHNDLNALNILVDPQEEARIRGVIDFGDITYTALIADVAVAAAELIPPDCTDPAAARACVSDVARAYHEQEPLVPQELAILGVLVAARLLMNVVVHEWHVHHNPAGGHHAALHSDYMATRLAIAQQLLLEEFTL
jgi:hydroxylysine kinase